MISRSLRRARAETKAQVEAAAARKVQLVEDHSAEQRRAHEQRVGAACQKRIDEAVDQRSLEQARADAAQRDLDAARKELAAARAETEAVRREKNEALKEAAAQSRSERHAAVG